MRIGLYGMPTAGKTYIMGKVDFLEVIGGTNFLRQYDPSFDTQPEEIREKDRREVAKILMEKQSFLMDGHYAFGDFVAFTEEEGEMYDVYLYLYIDPVILRQRMEKSPKNFKHLKYDLIRWQKLEIDGLRNYCHQHNKDFYVIDKPPDFSSEDPETVISFIHDICNGYSCIQFAKNCVKAILQQTTGDSVVILDGDKTLTIEDTSNRCFGYLTHLYDGNFYTGYQAWKQNIEFQQYSVPDLTDIPVRLNEKVLSKLTENAFILTSGHKKIWSFISDALRIPFFCGVEMSAETKYYITKLLQEAGKTVVAYGDGMNDYYMLKQADTGYLVTKQDGSVSRSLKNQDLEGLFLV
jgi:hypothetical protein